MHPFFSLTVRIGSCSCQCIELAKAPEFIRERAKVEEIFILSSVRARPDLIPAFCKTIQAFSFPAKFPNWKTTRLEVKGQLALLSVSEILKLS